MWILLPSGEVRLQQLQFLRSKDQEKEQSWQA
jgi:hypothetical protein